MPIFDESTTTRAPVMSQTLRTSDSLSAWNCASRLCQDGARLSPAPRRTSSAVPRTSGRRSVCTYGVAPELMCVSARVMSKG